MPPSISEAEWEVMRAVWAGHPATANEVVERLAGEKDWSPRTIKTMLNRLVKKRALGFTEEGKRYLYRPLVTQEQCVREESRSFLDRVFGGALGPMLNHFVRNEKLSAEEVADLKRLLAKKEK
jgi:BlaI family transcriptional regulator, penicillinase repressor